MISHKLYYKETSKQRKADSFSLFLFVVCVHAVCTNQILKMRVVFIVLMYTTTMILLLEDKDEDVSIRPEDLSPQPLSCTD